MDLNASIEMAKQLFCRDVDPESFDHKTPPCWNGANAKDPLSENWPVSRIRAEFAQNALRSDRVRIVRIEMRHNRLTCAPPRQSLSVPTPRARSGSRALPPAPRNTASSLDDEGTV